MQGFQPGCSAFSGCLSGQAVIDSSIFDGIYFFAAPDPVYGYPIYWKPIESEDFPSIHSLILWHGQFEGSNTELLTKDGLYAAITPNEPNFNYALFEAKAPFAFRFGTDGPPSCRDMADFPHCMTHDNQWMLARHSSAQCSGEIYNSRCCRWRIPHIHFYGTDIPKQPETD